MSVGESLDCELVEGPSQLGAALFSGSGLCEEREQSPVGGATSVFLDDFCHHFLAEWVSWLEVMPCGIPGELL